MSTQRCCSGTMNNLTRRVFFKLCLPPRKRAKSLRAETYKTTHFAHLVVLLLGLSSVLQFIPHHPRYSKPHGQGISLLGNVENVGCGGEGHSIVQDKRESCSINYTWIGQHFIPPNGVPTYGRNDYNAYFRKKNTLFIGDSTARRAYATLFGIMTSSDHTNVLMSEVDGSNLINFNSGRFRKETCTSLDRSLMANTTHIQIQACRNLIAKSQTATGKFDLIYGQCMGPVHSNRFDSIFDIFSNRTSFEILKEDYDLIIIAIGTWDAIRANDCFRTAQSNTSLTIGKSTDLVLDLLSSLSSPGFQIVFRTPGFEDKHRGQFVLEEIANHAAEYFRCHNPNRNLLSVDWACVIAQKSFGGGERIRGEIAGDGIHYGLEGRLLFLQMLLHTLVQN